MRLNLEISSTTASILSSNSLFYSLQCKLYTPLFIRATRHLWTKPILIDLSQTLTGIINNTVNKTSIALNPNTCSTIFFYSSPIQFGAKGVLSYYVHCTTIVLQLYSFLYFYQRNYVYEDRATLLTLFILTLGMCL